MWPFSSSNTAIIAQKRSERSEGLRSAPEEVAENVVFLKATASEIVERIEKGEWTATRVLEAYIARAAIAHEKTNCLTEVFFERARKSAAELDEEFSRTGKLRGPLHGVPISIKDQFDIEGMDSTIGFTQWSNKPAVQNADVVNKLLAAGALLYVKTNVPQTMFAFECSNPLFGRTVNPHNALYTCGGSSGGEAALLAMDGSVAGVGSDIGGSLRIPAAYCGIYSMKPAGGRISYFGARATMKGFDAFQSVAGPMGRSVADLELISRILFGGASTNNDIPPLPFREVTLPKKMKFGYYTSDNYIKASPACARAVLETVEALRKAGHECVEFEFPGARTACEIFIGLSSSEKYKTLLSHLGPDEKVFAKINAAERGIFIRENKENALFLVTLAPSLPSIVRNFAAWIIDRFIGDEIFAGTLRSSRQKGVEEYWKINEEKYEFRRQFQKLVWEKYEFDAIICPIQAIPQLPHGGCDNFSALALGTMVYNVLDLPAGCLPVTRVDPTMDALSEEWWQGPGHGSKLLETGIFKGTKALYKPEEVGGMPVCVQVVCQKWEEEKLLKVMSLVSQHL